MAVPTPRPPQVQPREETQAVCHTAGSPVPTVQEPRPEFAGDNPGVTTVLVDQRMRWQQGEQILVEVYLAQQPALNADADAVLDLIAHEVMLRQEQGEKPRPSEYQRRFPDLAAQIAVQFEVERHLRDNSPDTLSAGPAEAAKHAFLKPPRGPGEIGWLGPYRVLKVLGTGGMGIVFQAEDPQLKRLVALKTLKPAIAANAVHRQRFLREAQAAALLPSDHIVPIYHVGEDDGVPFLAMPFLEGSTLDRRLKEPPPLTAPEVVRLGMQIALGLAVAHERGLVHRDIKPANIMLVSGGVVSGEWSGMPTADSPLTTHHSPLTKVKLLDFGLARVAADDTRLTHAGTILGTPAYMAPEQTGGGEVDARADLFSLGTVLYEMATGKRPFQGANFRDVLAAVVAHTPSPPRQLRPELPAALDRLIMRLLSKRPADRPASAREVAETLRAIAAGEEGRTPARRHWLVACTAAVGLAAALALVLWLVPRKQGGPVVPGEPAPLAGELMNVLVWSAEAGKDGLDVRQREALPVRNGEQIQIEIQLNQPAHLYLLWIDSEGGLAPLYPWNQGNKLEVTDAATPPPVVDPVARLLSPPAEGHGWKLAGPGGLETVILLARRTPMPADFPLVKKIGKQKRLELRNPQELAVRAWERGGPVPRENLPPDLFRRLEREAAPIEEALMGMMKRLKDDFELIRLVQFAHEGR